MLYGFTDALEWDGHGTDILVGIVSHVDEKKLM